MPLDQTIAAIRRLPDASTVRRALVEHQTAVDSYNATLDEEGEPKNQFVTDAADKTERAKLAALIDEQCRSPAEVQAKIRYFHDFVEMEGGPDLNALLRSLVTGVW